MVKIFRRLANDRTRRSRDVGFPSSLPLCKHDILFMKDERQRSKERSAKSSLGSLIATRREGCGGDEDNQLT